MHVSPLTSCIRQIYAVLDHLLLLGVRAWSKLSLPPCSQKQHGEQQGYRPVMGTGCSHFHQRMQEIQIGAALEAVMRALSVSWPPEKLSSSPFCGHPHQIHPSVPGGPYLRKRVPQAGICIILRGKRTPRVRLHRGEFSGKQKILWKVGRKSPGPFAFMPTWSMSNEHVPNASPCLISASRS